ncbi:hypothetical protein [Cellulomonas massiliensis]|uniref:hypothetical protein n=1 Tax=Cellulomonas massiliensis TaxID=1465811 RepID=UPI0002E40E39|nr:hypothetical protein [Cellulomonas massiliensis]
MNATSADVLPLGRAPRPTTGDELAARLRAALTENLRGIADASAARVTARVEGDDVPELDVDLTGLVVAQVPRSAPAAPPAVAVRERTPGVVGRLQVDAHPLTVIGVPVDVRADLAQVPFAWVETPDGALGAELLEPTADAPVTGSVRVAAPREQVVAAVRTVATQVAASQGVTLQSLDVALEQQGPRAVSVRLDAKVRKSLLSASVQARATATVTDDLVLRLSDVDLSSGNPLVGAMLAAARGRVDALAARPVDLAAQLPPGVRLEDVRIEVGEQLVLTARAV